MHRRVLCSLIAPLAAAALAATPALATDTPPPAPLQAAPPLPVIQDALKGAPGRCKDTANPYSGFGPKNARAARRSHVLRGRAHDDKCGVAMVLVSVILKRGKRCQNLTATGRLSRRGSCRRNRWLLASGTTHWRLTMPKRLPRATYKVRTLAVDYAGNYQRPRTGNRVLRLRLR